MIDNKFIKNWLENVNDLEQICYLRSFDAPFLREKSASDGIGSWKIGTREKIQLWDFSSCTVFRIARRECRRDWISIMRRGFFLVATQHRAPKIYQRFWTIPFLSIHGCGSLNFSLRLFWSISARFSRSSLEERIFREKNSIVTSISLF